MFDIKELAVIDRKKGYCGKNIIFKTLGKDNAIAIVGIEEQKDRQNYCASLYIAMPSKKLINACKRFVEDNDILYKNKKLEFCIKNFGYKKNNRFNTGYDFCRFVNIRNNVYLCFHRWLGDKEEQKPTFEEYFNMIANTYNDVVSVILEVFHTYCLEQLDKKKIECFEKILKQPPEDVFSSLLIRIDYKTDLMIFDMIERDLKVFFNIKSNKTQYQKILYDRKKYKVS